jgi:hypothetical protein
MEPTRRLPPGITMTFGNNTVQINIMWQDGGWAVAYPVIPELVDETPYNQHGITYYPTNYRPGQMVQWLTMPLMEFLNMLADEYKLRHVLIANID